MSDVPLKIQEFAIVISDSKSLHRLNACQWYEIDDIDRELVDGNGKKITSEFMMHPHKLYRITFTGKQYQFIENSELQVS